MIPIQDNLSCKTFAWVTYLLIALNIVGFAIELHQPNLNAFVAHWGLIPADFVSTLGSGSVLAIGAGLLTILTASFLHGGWMHIIGNMVFLQAFGRSVESRMGSLRFLSFYLLSCFASWGLFVFSDPSSTIPALGASAPIAAVMGAYLLLYPRADMKSLFFVSGWPAYTVTPVWSFIGVWIGMQLVSGWGAILDPATANSVAVWAHIGGALFGGIFGALYALVTPDIGICYVPISCGCDCGPNCKKSWHNNRWFQFRFFGRDDWAAFLPFWAMYVADSAAKPFAFVGRMMVKAISLVPTPPVEQCDHDHDHKSADKGDKQ